MRRPEPDADDDSERLPLSALNHLLYCERRCALIHVEGVFVENVYTIEGSLAHEVADTPGYETAAGIRVVRALPLHSKQLGLVGKADIVEFRGATPYPVDYKRGKRKKWVNDDVQLCAQALCLEEMLQTAVPSGAIFHGESKRRREVHFTSSLRAETASAISRLRLIVEASIVPQASIKPQCEGCSLNQICLPELAESLSSGASRLFSTFD